MNFEWLQMRIQEEQDRRSRENTALERLPLAIKELHGMLQACVDNYKRAFGKEAADIHLLFSRIKVTAREMVDGKWQPAGKVEVISVPELPGFRVERGEYSLAIELGVLPNERFYYRDCEQDKYLTLDDLTRRILDRTLFPRLRE